MTDLVPRLVQRFKSNPDTKFSDREIEVLADAAHGNVWAAKAAALHYYRANSLQRALELMMAIARAEPTDESIVNVAVLLRTLQKHEEALTWLQQRREQVDPIRYHDMMCSLSAHLNRTADAVTHGDEALRLKDQAVASSGTGQSYVIRTFDKERRGRNIIAFSVWGADERYLRGAINNAIVARYLYPGWTARFYTDESTPEAFRAALQQNAADIKLMPAHKVSGEGLFWRFYVEDDEDVDIYIVRDADSVMNIKERSAVAEWLKSGRAFHVIRDSRQHSELMLAGMWGAHRGNIGDMRGKVRKFRAGLPKTGNYLHMDQHFLRAVVWPIARGNLLTHDRYFNFMQPRRFDSDYELPAVMHIGQNDWVFYRNG